jgi:hypothetical protein
MPAGRLILQSCEQKQSVLTETITETVLWLDAKDSIVIKEQPSARVIEALEGKYHDKVWKGITLSTSSNSSTLSLYNDIAKAKLKHECAGAAKRQAHGCLTNIYITLPRILQSTNLQQSMYGESAGLYFFKYIKSVTLKLNHIVLEKQSGEAMQVWNERCLAASIHSTVGSSSPQVTLSLPFWFCRHQYAGLSLDLLKNNEMELEIEFQSEQFARDYIAEEDREKELTLKTTSLYLEFTYYKSSLLGSGLMSRDRDVVYMYEFFETIIDQVTVDPLRNVRLSLEKIRHPIKLLYWTIRQPDTPNNINPTGISFQSASVLIQGQTLVDPLPRVFFTHELPSQHLIEYRSLPNTRYTGFYSFAIDPQAFRSTGYFSFEHLAGGTLVIAMLPSAIPGTVYQIQCHVLCYNWYKVSEEGLVSGRLI